MRIAMIHTSLTAPAGGERQILRLAIELQKFGHHVECCQSAEWDTFRAEHFGIIR